ncbi:MAG: FecR family protein [Proteobacteria bacterium]|nr:FecR family protein [Pseudomonadota bacterium]MBU1740677.1 FecR family protein [Pseudomonadota bacterium]
MTLKSKLVLWLAVVYAASCLIHPALAAAGGHPVARVSDQKGRASVTRGPATTPLALKAPLFLKDVVVTAEGTRLILGFVDGSSLTVAEDTRLVIASHLYDSTKKSSRTVARLISGAVKLTTSQLLGLKDRRFQIKTHTATAGVRGTSVIVLAGKGRPPAGLGTPPARRSARAEPVRLAAAGSLAPWVLAGTSPENSLAWTFIFNASLAGALVYVLLNSNPTQTIVLPPGFVVWVFMGYISLMMKVSPVQLAFLNTLFAMAWYFNLLQIMTRYGQLWTPGSQICPSSSSSPSPSPGQQR